MASRTPWKAVLVLTVTTGLSTAAIAHQPVMDMAPRWQGGWGYQIRYEYAFSDALLHGSAEEANPLNREQRVQTAWLEGVYTFRRELRLTLKLPWIDQRRIVDQDGTPVAQTGSGVGDAIIGLQLKRYYNNPRSTGNFGLTPSVRVPSGSTSSDFPAGDGSWDVGLSTSFSAEMAHLYQYYDLYAWHNGEGERGIDRGDEIGFDFNLGLHPYHDNLTNTGVFVMLDISAHYESRGKNTTGTTGGKRVSLGPVLVLYRNNLMLRSELKIPVFEEVWSTQLSKGTQFLIGLGATY